MAMPPKAVLPSVRKQWHSTPYSFAMAVGDYDYANEGVHILDDGTIWWVMGEAGGSIHCENYQTYVGMGTVSPGGWVQWSGDTWSDRDAADGPNGEVAMADEYYIWDTVLPPQQWYWVSFTDGRYIYYQIDGQYYEGVGTFDRGNRFYRLDPQTGLSTWIAGAPWSTYSPLDSHDGRLARLPTYIGPYACDRNYFYFAETDVDSTGTGAHIRRMKLEPPYPIETVFRSNPSIGFGDQWTIYPDGFRGHLQSDYWSSSEDQAMAVYDGYLYALQGADLRRVPVTGGSVENIIYGGNTIREDRFSTASGWTHSPDRYWIGWNSARKWPQDSSSPFTISEWDYPGVPDLEGLDISNLTEMKVVGNRMFFINNSANEGANISSNWWGRSFCYFDMDNLLEEYGKSGPRKPNRANPSWNTISNGTAQWESDAALNNCFPRSSYRDACGYIQNERTGSEPLHQWTGDRFDFNPNATAPWNQRLVFVSMHNNFGEYFDWYEPQNIASASWGVCYLEEEGSSAGAQYNLSIQFTGDYLKGYGAARAMSPAKAPAEVHLKEVNG